jgi:hypothetical protein
VVESEAGLGEGQAHGVVVCHRSPSAGRVDR